MATITERYAVAINAKSLVVDERTTRPCKKCGGLARYRNGDCRNCADKRSAAYNKKNKAAIRKQRAAYRAANKEKIKAQKAEEYRKNADQMKALYAERYAKDRERILATNRMWAEKNQEKVREYKARWVKNHPEKVNLKTHAYRARKRGAGGQLSLGLAEKLFVLQKGKCPCCGRKLGKNYQMDHKMPLALGGENVDDNIQLLRAQCNASKRAKHPVDFMQSRGFLL